MRESFIFAGIAAFLAGFNFLMQEKNKRGYILLFLGSYGLLSTKSYLWACLIAALILSCIVFVLQRIGRRKILTLLIVGLLVPGIAFMSTTSIYALNYIFKSDISATGERSGDSISQIYIERPSSGAGAGAGSGIDNEPIRELITFHGDYSLIALHFYLLDNPNSLFSKALGLLRLDKKIQTIWDEKIKLGLVHKDKKVGKDTSSLNGHILKPGKINELLSMIWPAFVFFLAHFHL